MQTKNKNRKSLFASWSLIVVCFLLGIYDMINLSQSFRNGGFNLFKGWELYLVTMLIATVANFCAFTWGMENGRTLAKKSINKKSVASFLIWVAIGIMYVVIRVWSLYQTICSGGDAGQIMGEIVQMVLLLIFYIGTGLTISVEARNIFDADMSNYRRAKKEFEEIHTRITERMAEINGCIEILQEYNSNYETLEKQYNKINDSIYKAENASMSMIVGKVIEKHPAVNPLDAQKVKDDFLNSRSIENDKSKNNA